MFVTAIIVAGGTGRRVGAEGPKQLLVVGGRTILERSVAAFLGHPAVNELVVALPKELADDPPAHLRGTVKPLRVVSGGLRRQDSVTNAFRAASPGADIIVIHDAARPFVSSDLITRTINAAAEAGAALAAVPARDTVKRSSDPAGAGQHIVAETLPRESIYLAQTPQAFRAHVLADALASTGDATDEAALAERAGHPVRIVDGDASNIKITTPDDVVLAEAIARRGDERRGTERAVPTERDRGAGAPGATMRIGTGYDLHRLVEGRPLVLGGVTIPFDRGLQGHSDADAICHAVTDAVLGAAAADDIGRHFPDSDARWRGASSLDLLERAVALVRDRGFAVSNVDAVVIAERPILGPYIEAMRTKVAAALGVTPAQVGIKGKTNEGVGELGRNEAIAVHAVALLVRNS